MIKEEERMGKVKQKERNLCHIFFSSFSSLIGSQSARTSSSLIQKSPLERVLHLCEMFTAAHTIGCVHELPYIRCSRLCKQSQTVSHKYMCIFKLPSYFDLTLIFCYFILEIFYFSISLISYMMSGTYFVTAIPNQRYLESFKFLVC